MIRKSGPWVKQGALSREALGVAERLQGQGMTQAEPLKVEKRRKLLFCMSTEASGPAPVYRSGATGGLSFNSAKSLVALPTCESGRSISLRIHPENGPTRLQQSRNLRRAAAPKSWIRVSVESNVCSGEFEAR